MLDKTCLAGSGRCAAIRVYPASWGEEEMKTLAPVSPKKNLG